MSRFLMVVLVATWCVNAAPRGVLDDYFGSCFVVADSVQGLVAPLVDYPGLRQNDERSVAVGLISPPGQATSWSGLYGVGTLPTRAGSLGAWFGGVDIAHDDDREDPDDQTASAKARGEAALWMATPRLGRLRGLSLDIAGSKQSNGRDHRYTNDIEGLRHTWTSHHSATLSGTGLVALRPAVMLRIRLSALSYSWTDQRVTDYAFDQGPNPIGYRYVTQSDSTTQGSLVLGLLCTRGFTCNATLSARRLYEDSTWATGTRRKTTWTPSPALDASWSRNASYRALTLYHGVGFNASSSYSSPVNRPLRPASFAKALQPDEALEMRVRVTAPVAVDVCLARGYARVFFAMTPGLLFSRIKERGVTVFEVGSYFNRVALGVRGDIAHSLRYVVAPSFDDGILSVGCEVAYAL